jgi:nitrite reductase/ring-hydroxylating ferredoxin subunit
MFPAFWPSGVQQMHLAQIRLVRVSGNAAAVFNRCAHMRVAFNAQTLQQVQAGFSSFGKIVGGAAVECDNMARHFDFAPSCARAII